MMKPTSITALQILFFISDSDLRLALDSIAACENREGKCDCPGEDRQRAICYSTAAELTAIALNLKLPHLHNFMKHFRRAPHLDRKQPKDFRLKKAEGEPLWVQ